jgi:hypothetical protein
LGKQFWILHELLKVVDVLHLAGLGDPVSFFLEASIGVEVHDLLVVFEYLHEQEKAAYNCAGSAFSMVAVEDGNTVRVAG